MELFANELSIHRQFHEPSSFVDAFKRLMAMREAARRFGRSVHCHRTFLTVEAMPGQSIRQALQHLCVDQRRSVMYWLTSDGPFWDDLRRHGADDWLQCRGEVVTDSAVGEAAYRNLSGIKCGLVSVTPSDWDFSPIEVTWRREVESLEDQSTALENWRNAAALEAWLQSAEQPINSWSHLRSVSAARFKSLTFADNCFEPLEGLPFAKSASNGFLKLLDILNRFTLAFDANGLRTLTGQQIYQDYFTGDNALFSDSSDTEKHAFCDKLTFSHPNETDQTLFCSWHGKVKHGTLRLHFSWPIRSGQSVYIVYAGPKITKR